MGYRDDEEARRLRREAMAKELADAKKELATLEERSGRDRARKDRLAERIAELEKSPDDAAPSEPVAEKPEPKPSGRTFWGVLGSIGGWAFGLLIAGMVAASCFTCVIEETGCHAFERQVDLRWSAQVSESTGVNLPGGTECEIHATVYTDEDARRVESADIRVDCAGRTLYENDDSRPNLSQKEAGGTYWYTLACNESTSGDDATTFTWNGTNAELRRLAQPTFEVKLVVVETSEPWHGEPAYEPPVVRDPGFDATVVRTGRVVAVGGSPPVETGAACELRVRPIRTPTHNCRVHLACGGQKLFDRHIACEALARQPTTADKEAEAGPGLKMDLRAGTVRVQERGPGIPYHASIRLDP